MATNIKDLKNLRNIGIIAHNSKATLIEDFCIAYKGILSKHDIYT